MRASKSVRKKKKKKNEDVLKETSEMAALYSDIILPRYDYLVANRFY